MKNVFIAIINYNLRQFLLARVSVSRPNICFEAIVSTAKLSTTANRTMKEVLSKSICGTTEILNGSSPNGPSVGLLVQQTC